MPVPRSACCGGELLNAHKRFSNHFNLAKGLCAMSDRQQRGRDLEKPRLPAYEELVRLQFREEAEIGLVHYCSTGLAQPFTNYNLKSG